MRASLAAAGFADVAVTELEVTRSFASFDEFWDVQTIAFSAPGRTIAKLDPAQREELRALLREHLPAGAGGSVTYAATALAGKARRP
jgi:hypothetical protein